MTFPSKVGLLGVCLLGSHLLAGCKDPDTHAKAPVRPAVAVVRPQPTATTTVSVAAPPSPKPAETPANADESAQGIETTAAKVPSHRGEDPPQRKSFADISAHTSFAHAPDYSWLCGEVEYSRISKAWRLRYASVDEEDPYGGSVTLAEHPLLHGLKDGQYVRVQGRLSNPSAKGTAPPYLIDSLQPIGSQEPATDTTARQ